MRTEGNPGSPRGTSALRAAVRAGSSEVPRLSRATDAVVVGAGATGGLAALLLAEAGQRVLVLDAGPPGGGMGELLQSARRRLGRRLLGERWTEIRRKRQPVQAHCYAWGSAPEAFVDDVDLPYECPPGQPFVWIRSRQLGGRLKTPGHGRQYYRLGPADLVHRDGASPDWPLSYEELATWYSRVEARLGMAGMLDGDPWVPDSVLERELLFSPAEAEVRSRILDRWPEASVLLSRFARPHDFLDQAAETGRLAIRQGAVVREVDVDKSGRVSGVAWVDHRTRRIERLATPLVFLCASALESTRLLLLSRGADGTQGIGKESGALGEFLMDHIRIRLTGHGPARIADPPEEGRCLYLPRFDTRTSSGKPGERGFGVQIYGLGNATGSKRTCVLASYGEMLPGRENRVTLHPSRVDTWGVPVLEIRCTHGLEDVAQAEAQQDGLLELAEALSVTPGHLDAGPAPPGSSNHESGTARIGTSPANSVLDPWNECWTARGLFVTDGACLPSQGIQNPTLTYLALTARACARAVGESPVSRPDAGQS